METLCIFQRKLSAEGFESTRGLSKIGKERCKSNLALLDKLEGGRYLGGYGSSTSSWTSYITEAFSWLFSDLTVCNSGLFSVCVTYSFFICRVAFVIWPQHHNTLFDLSIPTSNE